MYMEDHDFFDNFDEIDAIIEEYGEEIMAEEQAAAILNPVVLKRIGGVYAISKELFKSKKADVTYGLHTPFKSMGYVTIEGGVVGFRENAWFARLCALADNAEVYPLANGSVRMCFGFHGLTERIDEEE